jgi:hypothetical protein
MPDFRRKRDGALYTTSLTVRRRPGFDHWGDCYRLVPVWEGRTHYKTVAAFNREFVTLEGTKP